MLARSKDITDDPILVSITIGVNDFEFADKEKAEYHLRCDDAWVKKAFPKEYYCGQTDAEFHLWVEKTRAAVKAQVRYQVEERLHKEKPNAVVVITDYYDPLKDIKPIYFTKNIKKGPVEAEVVCSTCEERWRYAITRLNDVFAEIRNELGNPQWLQLTGDQEPKTALPIRERFVEHEAPAPECGKVDRPGKTWILPKSPEKVNDPKTLRDDCVHPNAEGAKQIAKTVNFEASKAGR